ncbi:MAG TPA: DUF6644 family protein [Steroidobacteraceae bacterium]
MHLVSALAAWLSQTTFSAWLGEQTWVLPTIQSIHILAVAVVMICMIIVNLRVLGFSLIQQSLPQAFSRFLLPAWCGLCVLLLTGLIMIIGEPQRELANTVFWVKMLLIVVAVLSSLGLARVVGRSGADMPRKKRLLASTVAVSLLLIWPAILACGRWIAYTQ